jgi:hypothetical protein
VAQSVRSCRQPILFWGMFFEVMEGAVRLLWWKLLAASLLHECSSLKIDLHTPLESDIALLSKGSFGHHHMHKTMKGIVCTEQRLVLLWLLPRLASRLTARLCSSADLMC